MTKPSMSVLLVILMAVSGFAVAQSSDAKSGTQGGAGSTGVSGLGDNGRSVKNRSDVKAERTRGAATPGIQGGSGSAPELNPNTSHVDATPTTAAERKALREQYRVDSKTQGATNRADGTAAGPTTETSGSLMANPGPSLTVSHITHCSWPEGGMDIGAGYAPGAPRSTVARW